MIRNNCVKLIILILLIINFSCKERNYNTVINPIKTIDLTGDVYDLEGGPYYPKGICLTDSMFLLFCEKTDEYFTFFSKENYKTIGTFGIKGKGPGELYFPTYLQVTHNNDIEYLWILDVGQLKFARYPVDSILFVKNYKPYKYFFLPPELSVVQRILYINDTLLVGVSGNNRGRLFFWNPDDNSIKYTQFLPKITKNMPKNKLSYAYNSYIGLNPISLNIASAFVFFNQIDIFTIDGNHKKLINIEKIKQPDLFQKDGWMLSDKTMYYYRDIFCTTDNIYVLYYGHDNYSIENKYDKLKSRIFVFDWAGKFLISYNLDQPLDYFSVDENNGLIYGVNLYNEKPFAKYKITN